MKNFKSKKIKIVAMMIFLFGISLHTIAAAPTGNFWFQIFTQTQTGSDNTGDGGTGNPSDYNYYYVGQTVTFRTDVSIGATYPSNTADLIVGFDKNIVSGSTLTSLSAYQNWVGQNIDNTNGIFKLSAYNNPGVYYTGQRQYANISFTMLKPTAYNYGLSSTALNINYTSASTTDSNIARDGLDYMDSKEDFNMIVWADTKKPYVKNPNPTDGSTGVLVTSNYTFDIRDSKNGEGDDSGVGTGFTAPPTGRTVNINNGVATTSYTSLTSHSCSGTFQTLCNATVVPTSPLGISGDTRKWNYNTLYTVQMSGYQDRASTNQSQLGDVSGPNKMATTTYTFRTESDTTAPVVSARTPAAGAVNQSVSTQIIVDIIDIKTTNVSGVGVNPSTCKINVSSANTGLTTYTSSSSGVATSSIPYGYRFTITPIANFPQNEIIYVSTYECQDLVGNMMLPDNFSFTTVDAGAPYIASFSPNNSTTVATNTPVRFVILDSGTGVDIDNTIVYIKGNYYKKGGGAGSVNVSSGIPVNISFSTSTNLNSFITATTTATESGYVVSINNLSLGPSESVPVIIYSKDLNNNVMPTYITSFMTTGSSSPVDGSTYCGGNTTWNGTQCIGNTVIVDGSTYCGSGTTWNGTSCVSSTVVVDGSTYCGGSTVWNGVMCVSTSTSEFINASAYCGGNTTWNGTQCIGTSGGSGGGCYISNNNSQLGVFNAFATQINSNGVLITWNSGELANGEIRYGTSESNLNNIVKEDTNSLNTYHSIVINNLETGKMYYFMPISKKNSNSVSGSVLRMSPLYSSKIVDGSKSPNNNTSTNSSYTTICRPLTIVKEINTSNSTYTENLNSDIDNNKDNATSSTVLEKTTNIISKNIIYIVLGILVLLIATLSILFIRHSKLSNYVISIKEKIKNMFKSKYLTIGLISLLIILGSSLFFIYKTNLFNRFFNKVDNTPRNISVKGHVSDPFTLQGVGDVYLSTGNVAIKTAPDGIYAFEGINNQEGLKITHPNLQRSLIVDLSKIKTESTMEIYFDYGMFNTLNSYLNNLNMKKFIKAEESLTNSCKEKISVDMLSNENISFEKDFSSLQILEVSDLASINNWYSDACQNRFQRVAKVSVKINGIYQDFILTKEGETWKIIK